jgi:hypothetical protein
MRARSRGVRYETVRNREPIWIYRLTCSLCDLRVRVGDDVVRREYRAEDRTEDHRVHLFHRFCVDKFRTANQLGDQGTSFTAYT